MNHVGWMLLIVVSEIKTLILGVWSLLLIKMDHGCYSWMLFGELWLFVIFLKKQKTKVL